MATWQSSGGWPAIGNWPGSGGLPASGNWPGSAAYSFATDSRIIAWYEPDNGLVNKFAASPWGDLVEDHGAVPIGGGLDGHPAYQFTKGSSGALTSTNTGAAVRFYGPIHTITIAKSTSGSNLAGDGWFADPVSGTPKFGWNNASGAKLTGNGGNFIISATTANYNCYDVYMHGSICRYSLNGAAYSTTQNGGVDVKLGGIVLGASASGLGALANVEIAFHLSYEGQMTEQFRSGLWAYLRAKFTSLSLPSTMPTAFDIRPTDPNSLLVPPFDVLPYAGQSNASSAYSDAAVVPFNAGIYMLGNDNTYQVATTQYDSKTNQADTVSAELITPKTFGGECAALCNAIVARTGRPLVLIPGMLGGSFTVPGTIVPPQNFSWDPAYPRGFKLANSLYGSWVRRTRDALARGGTYLFTGFDQGEAESGSGPTLGDQWPAALTSMMNQFHADIGVTKKLVFMQISPNIGTIYGQSGADFRAITQPRAIGPGQVMASAPDGPYNANPDQVHRQGSGCDAAGVAVFNAAVAAGYIPAGVMTGTMAATVTSPTAACTAGFGTHVSGAMAGFVQSPVTFVSATSSSGGTTMNATMVAVVTSPTASCVGGLGTGGYQDFFGWQQSEYLAALTRKHFSANVLS